MKKTLIVALAVAAFGLSASALAQTAGPAGVPPQSPLGTKPQGERLTKAEMEKVNADVLAKLGLTDDQKSKILAHQKETEEKLKELRKANKGAKGAGVSEETKEKVKAIRKENQEFMKTILTKPQLKEYARLRREEIQKLRAGTTPTTGKP